MAEASQWNRPKKDANGGRQLSNYRFRLNLNL